MVIDFQRAFAVCCYLHMDYFSYNNINNYNISTLNYNRNLAYNITSASSHDAHSCSFLHQDKALLKYDPSKQSDSMQNDIAIKSDDAVCTGALWLKICKMYINLHATFVIKSYESEVKQNGNQLVSIHVLKNYLKNLLNIMEQLQNVNDTLQSTLTPFSLEQWKKMTLEIRTLTNDLSSHFESADKIMVLKELLKLTRRQMRQRKAKDRKLQSKIHQREHKHRRIAKGLRGIKDAAESIRIVSSLSYCFNF